MADNNGQGGNSLAQGTANLILQALNGIRTALSSGGSIPVGSVQSSAGASAGYAPVTIGGQTYVVQIFKPS